VRELSVRAPRVDVVFLPLVGDAGDVLSTGADLI
jgi:hypothetical protein